MLSTSVLRFAHAFTAATVDPASVLSVRATVRHDVGIWATGYNPWQDTPGGGGGTMVTMGIHGVELLVALLGPAVRLAGAAGAVRHYTGLRSEDTHPRRPRPRARGRTGLTCPHPIDRARLAKLRSGP
ncbi:hypothetical protein [Nonomuraea sp. NPDC003804]|uniref:hypothetical protein n=1 Tax=Nonomuraea sp. NPDC003804 TaxID=3154547 RepID=UPI0033BD6C5B